VPAGPERRSVPLQGAAILPPGPNVTATNPANIYLVYTGRYRRQLRIAGVILITWRIATSPPEPGIRGHGLVILASVVVAVSTQLMAVVLPARFVILRTTLGAISCGVLTAYDPGTSTVLLVLAGLDAGAMLDFRPGALVAALAFLSDALGVLASGRPAVDAGLGLAAVAGFLAATTFKQYILRSEEAELRLADTERAAEEHALAVRLAERANAAREIHDILAHSLGALVLQLDAVEALLGREPADVERALPLVGRARLLAAEGLNESRRAVGSLRHDPLPIVDSLGQLVAATDAARLEVTGTPWPLPSEVSLAVRRTAQESLTNAAKHAPGSTPVLHLRFDAEQLVLTVSDDGRPDGMAPASIATLGGGFGLDGLRERARLIGGTLVAGPTDGGWQVVLRVPHPPATGRYGPA
jgi:signal transduction histidine kinase